MIRNTCFKRVTSFKACLQRKTFERIFVFTKKKNKNLITFYSKNQAVKVVLLKLVYSKWRILGICCIFLYFQLQIRALYVDFETHVFIRFLISIKFSIIINHKKRGGGGRKLSSAYIFVIYIYIYIYIYLCYIYIFMLYIYIYVIYIYIYVI